MIDVTREDDFTSQDGLNKVISNIKGPDDVFFYCSPCTGGTALTRMNIHRANVNGWWQTLVNLIGHWDLHWRLWDHFELAARHCASVGAAALLEWPRFCEYWKEERVMNLLTELGFQFADFDGCMYGLVARHGSGTSLPIRKPWRIACLNIDLPRYLNLRCDGRHRHAPCASGNALFTQGYTPAIADLIRKCVAERARAKRRPRRCVYVGLTLDPPASAAPAAPLAGGSSLRP